MGIDIGTTSVKAGVFNESGDLLRYYQEDYQLINNGDYIEFNADEYVNIAERIISKASEEFNIYAISVDTQGETLILCDNEGNPLRNAIVWLDNRAKKESDELKSIFGEKTTYDITGQPEITAGWPASKLLWVKRHEPEIWNRIRKIFLLEDFILFKLTGSFVTEKTIQSSSLYFNINTGCWWQEMLLYLGLKTENLPKILNSGDFAGYYRNIPVVTGALDQIAGAVGAGAVKEGIISEMTGTAMAICAPIQKLPSYAVYNKVPCHVSVSGKVLLMWTPTAGMALKWYKNNFCEDLSFADADLLAEKLPVGCDGLMMLPYLCGSVMPLYNPEASGVFYGFNLKHTRIHCYRAILESVAYILKSSLDYLNLNNIEEIRATGGGASSSLWCRIKADMTGKKVVTLKNSETACLGSAILAGLGTGVFPSLETACEKLVKTDKIYLPEKKDYSFLYEKYKKLENLILLGGIS
jgi:xylulokinase